MEQYEDVIPPTTTAGRPLVVYHDPCDDGFGAAFAAWKRFGDDADYLPMTYDDPIPHDLFEGRSLYVLDFSFPADDTERAIYSARSFVLLDHHKTAFKRICGRYERGMLYTRGGDDMTSLIRLDDTKSGARLAWEFFHPGTEVPLLIQYIEDNDLWRHRLDSTRAFVRNLRSIERRFEVWDHLCHALKEGSPALSDFIADGRAIERYFQQQARGLLRDSTSGIMLELPIPVSPDGGQPSRRHFGLAANMSSNFSSEAGTILAETSETFGLVWYQMADGLVKVSLRSRGGYDVEALAVALGGGGHAGAAGFICSIDTLQSWLAEKGSTVSGTRSVISSAESDPQSFFASRCGGFAAREAGELGLLAVGEAYFELQRHDEGGDFQNDIEAIIFALGQAAAGDQYAIGELRKAVTDKLVFEIGATCVL
jgi:hypothetical protein